MLRLIDVTVVVGVHGIAQQYRGPNELRAEWLPALRDGLTAAGHHSLSKGFREEDLEVSFFGDLFRPEGAMGSLPDYTADHLTSKLEINLLTSLYNSALQSEPTLEPPNRAMGRMRVSAQVMVDRILRSRTFAGLIPERVFVGSLKQVLLFLTDNNVKRAILDRVHNVIGLDTRVVVGHSLGSIVAYEYLCKYRPERVELLVTLGSPLGIRNVVFDRLTPAPDSEGGEWPGEISKWINIADRNDCVALRKDLSPLFPPRRDGLPVEDLLINVGGFTHHKVGPYLNTKVLGDALARVL